MPESPSSRPPLRERAPNPLLLLAEAPRAALEASSLLPALPLLGRAPRGDGHPVLVLPGFTGADGSTRVLREFLATRGYVAHRWRLGRNMGLRDGTGGRLLRRVETLHERFGRKVSLVGWSLGGIYARELAKHRPDAVRQVITLGSPFGGERRGYQVGWLHRAVTGEELSPEARARMNSLSDPPPVPATAIYSRTDGIAGWRACMETNGHRAENIEVPGSHCGLGFNPVVLWAIADRLAQPEHAWKPFERTGLRRFFFA